MWTAAFWKGAGERAIKTFFQSFIGGFVGTIAITAQPWLPTLGIAASAAVLSIATSLANTDFVAGDSSNPED